MPLQMQTTFMPSKSVRASDDLSAGERLSDHHDGAEAGIAESGCIADSVGVSVNADGAESQSGPSKPMLAGASPPNPFFSLGGSCLKDFCPGLKRWLSLRL